MGFDDAYDDILRVVRAGACSRFLCPMAAVAYIAVFKTMHKWIDAGLFQTAYERLFRLYRRRSRPRSSCVDSTFVKNVYDVDCVGRNRTDRGRMVSAAVDDKGVPYSLLCALANQSDMRLLQPTLAAAIVLAPAETPLYADKGYDSAANRQICALHGYLDRIFRRRTSNKARQARRRRALFRMVGQAPEAHPPVRTIRRTMHGNVVPGLRMLARRTHAGCCLKKK